MPVSTLTWITVGSTLALYSGVYRTFTSATQPVSSDSSHRTYVSLSSNRSLRKHRLCTVRICQTEQIQQWKTHKKTQLQHNMSDGAGERLYECRRWYTQSKYQVCSSGKPWASSPHQTLVSTEAWCSETRPNQRLPWTPIEHGEAWSTQTDSPLSDSPQTNSASQSAPGSQRWLTARPGLKIHWIDIKMCLRRLYADNKQ